MTMPNFFVVGAQKGGTSALHSVLAQHPQIFMSGNKEPRFFCFAHQPPQQTGPGSYWSNYWAVSELASYQALFDNVAGEIAIGESSTDYITGRNVEKIAENIRRHVPYARIIAILRQPADRAYSAFNFARQKNWEPLHDFVEAMAAEDLDERATWPPNRCYWRNGRYFTQLKPYFDRFPREQIRIYLYEEWLTNPADLVSDICRFLGVDATFQFDVSIKENETWAGRNETFQTLFDKPNRVKSLLKRTVPKRLYRHLIAELRRLNRVKPPPLNPALRHLLTLSYRDDILQLQELIGRDLTHWLTPKAK